VAERLADAASAFRAARQRNSDPGWLRARMEDFDRILACASNPELRSRLEDIRQLFEVPPDSPSPDASD
jgi:hypothetical protein